MIIRTVLLVLLVALAVVFIFRWWRAAASHRGEDATQGQRTPSLLQLAIGFITDFFDTLQFMRAGRFDARAALGLTLGGVPGVLIAGLFVQSLPLSVLRWLVVVVVVYAATIATMMLRSALAERRAVLTESRLQSVPR